MPTRSWSAPESVPLVSGGPRRGGAPGGAAGRPAETAGSRRRWD